MPQIEDIRIGVIGLGYVGLPLARLFSTRFPTIGYDINANRVDALMAGHDTTLEVPDALLQKAIIRNGFRCTTQMDDIRGCNFYVVAIPTPVNRDNAPDLMPLVKASETVGKVISKGDIVVYESTVYPGVTEDECLPVVERVSGLRLNEDFFAGYSPERINPGDKVHTVEKILKITSGSTPEAAELIDRVYNAVLENGTHRAPSIKVAEAAKVIENAQRDINIAFVNELAKICNLLGIDTHDVLDAAGTKWNFIKMNPGLVGGHCISVDPYYLAQCAQRLGYNPEVILSGRRMNDGMGAYVADQTIKLMLKKGIQVLGSKVIIMGFTFKENCPDVRNTRIIDIYRALQEYNVHITVYDPWADPEVVKREYGIDIVSDISTLNTQHSTLNIQHSTLNTFDTAIVAVGHRQFREMEVDFSSILLPNHVIYDVKSILPRHLVDGRL
jgi:UDP-N-acetyl-D-galactosamine dehydrogenase